MPRQPKKKSPETTQLSLWSHATMASGGHQAPLDLPPRTADNTLHLQNKQPSRCPWCKHRKLRTVEDNGRETPTHWQREHWLICERCFRYTHVTEQSPINFPL